MRTHELAKQLLDNPDVELLLQTDSEGNGYNKLCGCDFEITAELVDYEYKIKDISWDAEESDMTESEWTKYKKNHSGYAILFPY